MVQKSLCARLCAFLIVHYDDFRIFAKMKMNRDYEIC